MNNLAELVGARLQRIDAPHPDLLALSFFGDGKGVLALWLPRGGVAEWAWFTDRPRGNPANAWVQQLRKHLGNRRVRAVKADAAALTLEFEGAALQIVTQPANAHLLVEGTPRGNRHPERDEPRAIPLRRVSPERMTELLEVAERSQRRGFAKLARRRMKALRRRLAAIERDIRAADEATDLRHRGSLLLAHLHSISDGATEARVTDWNLDPPAERVLAIRPGKSAKEEAEALFRRARKRERGGEIALSRHELTQASLDRLADALRTLDDNASDLQPADLEKLAKMLEKEGARLQRAAGHRAAAGSEARDPFHRFEGSGDREIRVGRSAPENDLLTLHHAKPWDHWLHARGVPGSHVVIPLGRNETPPDALLLDAAHLAAHFSQLRGEPIVEIQHCARRHVVKPRGAAPGSVRVRKETVLVLRLERSRLEGLLGDT